MGSHYKFEHKFTTLNGRVTTVVVEGEAEEANDIANMFRQFLAGCGFVEGTIADTVGEYN